MQLEKDIQNKNIFKKDLQVHSTTYTNTPRNLNQVKRNILTIGTNYITKDLKYESWTIFLSKINEMRKKIKKISKSQ